VNNIELKREGTKLVVTIDLANKGSPSASGKTVVLGTTRGNQNVPGTTGVMVGINVYGYPGFEIV
jgi:hypothetical protein